MRLGACSDRLALTRALSKAERGRHRVDADRCHHDACIAVAVQFAVMRPTDWDRVLVADSSAEGSGLGKAEMMMRRGR
jgi:hypothetical protein